MSDIAIKVESISKRYQIGENKKFPTLRDKLMELPNRLFKGPKKSKEFWALRDVSFEIKKGEIVGIIGRNGAGKSTLLKILARITEPTSGQVTMYGRVASMLEVGTGFNQELTGRENIYLNGAIIGMSKKEIQTKFDDIVEFSGVGKFLDTPVKHYSSGMYVRLAFAVAAHLDADILLVDEVLAVGDTEFQKKCLGKMTDMAESGKTVIFVSHNITSIKRLCNRAILLENGAIKGLGEVHEILETYQHSTGSGNKLSYHAKEKSDLPAQIDSVVVRTVTSKVISAKEPILIDVAYTIRKKINALLYIMILDAQDQIYAFSSENENMPKAEQKLHEYSKGRYRARIILPANILQNGTYSFFAKIDNPFFKNYDSSQAITLNLEDRHEAKAVQWAGKIHPVVDMDVDWVVNKVRA